MRWLLLLVMMCASLALMGQDCKSNSSGGSGGVAGTGGSGGVTGTGGMDGTGGVAAGNDCGHMTTCEPGGVDDTCETYCDDLCEGGQDDVFADTCLDDGRCWCWCATGVCSEEDCIESPQCNFEADETFCEDACTRICNGADDIREAFCDGPGDTGYCECRCKVGGSVSCSASF